MSMPLLKQLKQAVENLNTEIITNENGTAIKYADGTMICRGLVEIPANTTKFGKNLPSSFIDTSYNVLLTNHYSNSKNIICSVSEFQKSIFQMFPVNITTQNPPTVAAKIHYLAIGRWK